MGAPFVVRWPFSERGDARAASARGQSRGVLGRREPAGGVEALLRRQEGTRREAAEEQREPVTRDGEPRGGALGSELNVREGCLGLGGRPGKWQRVVGVWNGGDEGPVYWPGRKCGYPLSFQGRGGVGERGVPSIRVHLESVQLSLTPALLGYMSVLYSFSPLRELQLKGFLTHLPRFFNISP